MILSILFWWMKATLYWNNDLWIIKILIIKISKKEKPIYFIKKLKTYKFNLILCFLIFLMFRDNNLNKEYSSFSSDLSPFLSIYISDHTVFSSSLFRWKLFRVTNTRTCVSRIHRTQDWFTGLSRGYELGERSRDEGERALTLQGGGGGRNVWGSEFKGAVHGKGIIIAGKMLELQR